MVTTDAMYLVQVDDAANFVCQKWSCKTVTSRRTSELIFENFSIENFEVKTNVHESLEKTLSTETALECHKHNNNIIINNNHNKNDHAIRLFEYVIQAHQW